jgi:hypothetical protein
MKSQQPFVIMLDKSHHYRADDRDNSDSEQQESHPFAKDKDIHGHPGKEIYAQ